LEEIVLQFQIPSKKEGTMPVSKNKGTTSRPNASTLPSSSLAMPDQHAFHEYLRALTQNALRTVIEAVMIEELDAFIGAAWGESSPKRTGYRNGSYTRDLVTSMGRVEEIKVPRDREGQFHTQAFERYSRYEPHIAEGLTQMFVAGVSTRHPSEKSLKPC
jgi:putative transposase